MVDVLQIDRHRQVLKDTTLCAIVRDEMLNPLGGIEMWLKFSLPHVEKAVVVDTGSKDGTWEVLQEQQKLYPHLHLRRIEFTGYAEARNASLDAARELGATFILVLDADELLTEEDYADIHALMTRYPDLNGLNFGFLNVFSDIDIVPGIGHNPRFFRLLPGCHYQNTKHCFDEDLRLDNDFGWPNIFIIDSKVINSNLSIRHILPREEGKISKQKEWYGRILANRDPNDLKSFSPFDFRELYFLWREYNPRTGEVAGKAAPAPEKVEEKVERIGRVLRVMTDPAQLRSLIEARKLVHVFEEIKHHEEEVRHQMGEAKEREGKKT
jgi:glycosyltransferase involved in cell wall biosynthesis